MVGQALAVVDLNSDLGEGFGRWSLGDDDALLGVVSSANVACGFHAGDPGIMRRVCTRAAEAGVAVGAQVGYHDLAGFGRRFIDIEPAELHDDVVYQLGALQAFARLAGTTVAYVKPHGALYNAVVHHEEQAVAVVHAVAAYDTSLPVLGLPGAALLRLAAEAGLRTVEEAFADRAYTPEGRLLPRRLPGAVLHDPEIIAARRCAWSPRASCQPSTAPWSRYSPRPCACTATQTGRWSSRGGCGTHCSHRARRSDRSCSPCASCPTATRRC